MPNANIIADVSVATLRARLPAPVIFGDWVMLDREYAVVRVRSTSGHEGWSFTLTRDGAVDAQVRRTVAPAYVGTSIDDRALTYHRAWRRSLPSHGAGVGLRALSIVDLAVWDLAGKTADRSVGELCGGGRRSMPATAIVGYPPAEMDAAAVGAQVSLLSALGWSRFKAPIAPSLDASRDRLRAARAAAPDAWIGCDAAWVFDNVDDAATFIASIEDVELGWFEDVFPPGDAAQLAALRERVSVKIAMGDEQGGVYYPQALIAAEAVDVVRIDLTCMGGITGGRRIVDECLRGGIEFAPHMFGHVHSQVFASWGFTDCPIEWGVPGTGVDPFADSLIQPELDSSGRMEPLPDAPGFGEVVDFEWVKGQELNDPQGILTS